MEKKEKNFLEEQGPCEKRESKGVIVDSLRFREIMKQFWHRELSLKSVKEELGIRERQHLEVLLGIGREMEVLRITGEKEAKQSSLLPENKNRFIFASQNKTKQELIARAAENQKMVLQGALFLPGQEEEKLEHQIIKRLIREGERKKSQIPTIRDFHPAFYAIDIAEAKALKMAETYKNEAIFSSDIVVLCDNKVLEKPEDQDQALKILRDLSGREVKVALGMTVLTPTSFGQKVLLKEGAYLTIKLRDFSESEAEQYFRGVKKENCLNVVGALDYANPLSRDLVSDRPIKLEVLEFGRKGGEAPKEVFISPDILSQLKDYFMGVPSELTQEMLKRVKLLRKPNK